MEIYHYVLAILGGFAAGFINTLAGSGSIITMSILMLVFQLPENIANGTNRLGVLLQSLVSTTTFYQEGKLNLSQSKPFVISGVLGALLGVWLAIVISNEDFRFIFTILMALMLVVVLVKPKRWLQETAYTGVTPWYIYPLFFVIGFYGGFIQMGVGILLLAGLVLGARYSIIEANGVKLLIVFTYTSIVMGIFAWKGLIDWRIGGILAIGQSFGGLIAARFATRHQQAGVWAHRVLIVVVIWVVLRLFGFSPI